MVTVSDDDDERDPTNWESPTPVGRIEGTGRNKGNAIQFSWWNLLLLLPLLMLIGFLPYATATEGHLAGNPVAALLRPHPGSAPAVLVDRDDRRVPRRCAEPRY